MLTQDLLILKKGEVLEAVKVESGKRFAELSEWVRENFEGFAIAEWLPARA